MTEDIDVRVTFLALNLLQSLAMTKRSSYFVTNQMNRFSVRRNFSGMRYVPNHTPPRDNDVKRLQDFLDSVKKVFVLTGAGISTESGIPDYRSEGVGLYATSDRRPVQYQDFVKKSAVRKRYWARNFVGWEKFSRLQPNIGHVCLSQWERTGRLTGTVTQNVDRLHQKAGSVDVVDLHGTGFTVRCLSCPHTLPRADFQEVLKKLNPYLASRLPVVQATATVRPDADVELSDEDIESFQVPPCPSCGTGFLQPRIVFFGDSVPKTLVESVKQRVDQSDGLLILGSSLHVFSGYRFLLRGKELGLPSAIVNIGPTRGDHCADVKISTRIGEVLPLIRFES